MANTMNFKGESNLALGVVVTAYPAAPAPPERGEWEDVLGREGSVWQGEGVYEQGTLSVVLWVRPTANLARVRNWLSGEGTLTFGAWNWSMRARVSAAGAFTPSPHNDGWNVTITFSVFPAWYKYPAALEIQIAASGTVIPNRGLVASKPYITLAGTGDITLQIGARVIEITGLSGSIEIDCEALTASDPLKVHVIDDLWPVLTAPTCTMYWTGSVTALFILPRWRLA